MKRGTPPTAPNARTGEFTPPGMTNWARENSASLRSVTLGFAGVDKVLEQSQGIGERVLVGGAEPARGQAGAVPGRRGEHVAVAAVPAQALRDVFRLAVKTARPPFVFVGGCAPGHDEEQHPVLTEPGHRAYGRTGGLHPRQRRRPRDHGHVEHIKNPAGDEYDVRLRPGFPPATYEVDVDRGLHLPGL